MKLSQCTGRAPRSRSVLIKFFAAIFPLAAFVGEAAGQQASRGTPSVAATPGGAELALRGPRPALRAISYGEWQKLCFKAGTSKTLCRTTINGKYDTGQTAVRVDLIEREGDDSARLQIFLPVGMYLQAGVKLSVDKGSPYPIPYTWCLTNACIAADLADPKMIEEMESGQTLVLEVADSNILAVTTSLPLGQFASVRNGAPVKTFEQDIDE